MRIKVQDEVKYDGLDVGASPTRTGAVKKQPRKA